MKLERAFCLQAAWRAWGGRREGSCFSVYFGFPFAMKERKGVCFGVFFGFVLFFNANGKEEKSQGGCTRQVLDISPAVRAGEERRCVLVKILESPELQWQQNLGAKRPRTCRCCPHVGLKLWVPEPRSLHLSWASVPQQAWPAVSLRALSHGDAGGQQARSTLGCFTSGTSLIQRLKILTVGCG